MGEGGIFIIVGINLLYLFDGLVALGISGDEDAPCKTTALGNEEYASIIASLLQASDQLPYCL